MIDEDKKWKRETSAGGVVFKIGEGSAAATTTASTASADRQIFILMIQTAGTTAEKNKVWTFPKGHLDGEETSEAAAIREVKEETGIEAKIVGQLGSTKYSFIWKGENVFKIVTWYLMEYLSGNPQGHDYEVEQAAWIESSEVEKMLKYPTDKETFKKAKKIINDKL